jgi:release factor glutamine methyltransferase
MRIDELLADATRRLQQAGVENPQLDARLLFQHLSAMSRSDLVLHGDRPVEPAMHRQFDRLVEQRGQRIPLQHLIGSQEFWSLDFTVSDAVLIPRPETEFLLERALAICRTGAVNHALDMCAGSGVIAVVLARELGCSVTAVDVSRASLAIAAANIARHGVADRVDLVCSDLFAGLNPWLQYDLIVSNPPYIVDGDIDGLEPEVARFEPRLALSGGAGGLDCIARIVAAAESFLRPGGWLFLEIGADQKESVHALLTAPERRYVDVAVLNDWSGRARVAQARYTPVA